MLQLKAAGRNPLKIDRASVVLAERAGPVVELGLATGQGTNSAGFRAWAAAAAGGLDAELDFGASDPLRLHLIGFRAGSDAAPGPKGAQGVAAVGLALPEAIRGWFDRRPEGADKFVWLVAQRGRGVDPWAFVTGTVGGRLAEPPGAVNWDALFGPAACVLRVGSWTNRCFLEHLVTLLTERTASVWGWAVVNDEREPLRLVTDFNTVALDAGWEAVDALPWNPTLLAGADWARRPAQVRTSFPCLDGPALIRRLTTCGIQADAGQFAGAIGDRVGQLVLLPGAVNSAGARLFATAVRYTWQLGTPRQAELILTLRQPVKPAARAASGALLLDAAFAGWGAGGNPAPGETLARFAPAAHLGGDADPNWAVLTGEAGVSPGGELAAPVLTPFAGREADDTAGFYATRRAADPFALVVASGHPPVALGQPQRFDPTREATGVTVNDLSLTLTASPVTVEDDDADAIRLAAGTIKAAAADLVQVMKNLTVRPAAVTCEKDVELPGDKTLAVGGDATFGADISVAGTATITDLAAGNG